MAVIKRFFEKYIKGENADETAVMLAVVSIFLPYIISAIVLSIVIVRALILKDSRNKILHSKDGKIVLVFMLINAAAPFYYKNYLGVACFFGISAILLFALYLRSTMTEKLFSRVSDAAAFMSISCAFVSTFIKAPEHDMRSPSVFFNPNYYGAMITFVILLCAYRLISKEGNRAFLIATILSNVYGLFMADCQSAFFAIAFGLWVLLLFKRCYKSFAVVTVAAVLGIVFLPHLTFIMPRISGALENILKRADIWIAGFKASLETLFFGRGLMGYTQIYEIFGAPKNFHCHNMFIDMLLSFGVVGSIPLIIFIVRNLTKIKGKKTAPLILALCASALLHGLVDVTLIWIQTGAFAAFLLSAPFAERENQ